MAIAPINGINVRQNYNSTINFAGRKRYEDGDDAQQNPRRASNLATVPVVVLMAMTPGMLNGKQPVTVLPANEMNVTEVLAQTPEIKEAENTYYTSAAQFSNSSYDLSSFDPRDIQYKQYYKMNGKNWVMVWNDVGKSTNSKKNMVGGIFFVPETYRQIQNEMGIDINTPPMLLKMVYHNIGDSSFMTVITRETTCDDEGNNRKRLTKEYRIPDDVANKLIDLFVGDTEFVPRNNFTSNAILEEVNSARMKTPAELSNY